MKRTRAICRLALALVLLLSGCTAVERVGKAGKQTLSGFAPPADYAHAVAVVPFSDATGDQVSLDPGLAGAVVSEAAQWCKDRAVFMDLAPENAAPPATSPLGLDKAGAFTGRAREQGANLVLGGILWRSIITKEKRGIYGFRDEVPMIQAQMNLWVYDTLTGAKVLDKTITCESLLEKKKQKGMEVEAVGYCPADLRGELSAQATHELCNALPDIRWRAFIVSAEGKDLTITAGAAQGLSIGDILSVHERGETVAGTVSRSYVVPGPETGKARVASVSENQAALELTEGSLPGPGGWVTAD
ncbi:MAG: hypothetical protein JRI97_06940 [Deltaproteobacteria bacterium]|nr:hypothetical protein [Deltaproteobacteria bacterium]